MSREINKELFGMRETPVFEGRRTPAARHNPVSDASIGCGI